MSTFKIIGGTAGYNKLNEQSESTSSSKKLFMFKADAKVSPVFISKKNRIEGIVLPAFDASMDKTDTAYRGSYSPYRVRNITDPETGCPYFSDWFVTLEGYNYYGNGKMNFFSPKSIGLPDPIQEIRKYCWDKHNAGDTTYDYLINRPEKFGDPYALPKTSKLTLLNVVCPATYDKDPVQGEANRIMILKAAATDRLFADLNEPAYSGMAADPRDEWTNIFCRGDVTNPARAIKFVTSQGNLDNGMEYTYLSFGKIMLNGTQRVLQSKTTVISQEYLDGRFDLTDIDNVISIPTYQEIVDMLVQDKLIPMEIIRDVCGEKAKINLTATADDSDSIDYEPDENTYNTAAATPAPAPAGSMPKPAPAVAEPVLLYVTLDGKTVQMSKEEIISRQDPDLPVYNGTSWMPAGAFAWYKVLEAPAPAAPPTPAPSIMPQSSPVANARTAAQEKRFNELNMRLMADESMSPSEIDELSTLSRMSKFVG